MVLCINTKGVNIFIIESQTYIIMGPQVIDPGRTMWFLRYILRYSLQQGGISGGQCLPV